MATVKIHDIEVRVLKTEAHKISSAATQYPVEDGKSIIDHVNLNPNQVSITCEITNSNGGANQAVIALGQFIRLRDERTVINLTTEHALYKNMVLVNIAPVHQAPYKGALKYDLTFQQVGIVGEKNMINAQGGRPVGVLAGDGTSKTACMAQDAGTCPAARYGRAG